MQLSNRELFFRYLALPSNQPLGIEIERASGIWLYTPDGRRFADLVSGVSVSNVGHCHPNVVEAIVNQVQRYMHVMVYGELIQSPQTQLAERLTSLLPSCLNSVYLVNSGSEAIEGAMKLAKRYLKRPMVCSFYNAYHGGTQGALSILGHESLKQAFRPLLPGVKQLNFNSFDDLALIDEQVACVIVEPIQAEAGIILPKTSFLNDLRRKCNDTGALLVFDEVQTGFGRTGSMFAFEQFGVIPDILCLAKAMGGGMPIGAFVSSDQIMQSLTQNPMLGHITTFGGHPVSCAASLSAIDLIVDENLLCSVNEKASIFIDGLSDHPRVRQVRGRGLMIAVEMNNQDDLDAVMSRMTANGLLTDRFLFHTTSFRIAPPLTISTEECRLLLGLILKSLSEI
jgi:acetylornithine/succinyldiaminopimelate/putrescine aminotransferase